MAKLYDSFPYNENQRQLHIPEKYYVRNVKKSIQYFSNSKKERDALRKKTLNEIKEIKKQNPHPAEVLADFQGCFWDTDLYWCHWDFDKHLIIPRMLVMSLESAIVVLEKFYTKDEILETLRTTRENMPSESFEFVAKRYNMTFVPNIQSSPYDPLGTFYG